MGVPQIPKRSLREALVDVVESIALEEAALAHLLNAEAEKAQHLARYIIDCKDKHSIHELVVAQRSTVPLLEQVIRKQDILLQKLRVSIEAMPCEHEWVGVPSIGCDECEHDEHCGHCICCDDEGDCSDEGNNVPNKDAKLAVVALLMRLLNQATRKDDRYDPYDD